MGVAPRLWRVLDAVDYWVMQARLWRVDALYGPEPETEALVRLPSRTIDEDRYPLSPRIVALKEILGQLRPEPEREPLPPRRHYEPPSKGRYKRRG